MDKFCWSMQDIRKRLLLDLSGKVEGMLQWRKVVDSKQDEVDRKLDWSYVFNYPIVIINGHAHTMHKALAQKLSVLGQVDGNLVSIESMHKSEVQHDQAPTKALEKNRDNGDGVL